MNNIKFLDLKFLVIGPGICIITNLLTILIHIVLNFNTEFKEPLLYVLTSFRLQ